MLSLVRTTCTLVVVAASISTAALFGQVEWTLRNPTPTLSALTGIAASSDRIVCVGENGTIITSPDGEHWTAQPSARTVKFYRTEFVDDTFIARTDGGSIYFSTDGQHWERRLALTDTGSSTPQPGPVIHGNGVYAAVDSANANYHTSTDGVAWVRRDAPNKYKPGAFAFGAGLFVAVSDGDVCTSTDAVTWSARVQPDGFYGTPTTLLYAAGQFVANLPDGSLARSPNGRDWTVDAQAHAYSLGFAHDRFFARIGEQIVTSPDAATWTPLAGVPATIEPNHIAWLDGTYAAFSRNRIYLSTDAATWHELGASFETPYADGIAFAAGQFLTYDGHSSPDGITWTATGFTPPPATSEYPARRIAAANDRFFFFNDQSVFASLDGRTGQQVATLTYKPTSVAFGASRYVIAGYENTPTQAVIATSPDGLTWTEQRLAGTTGIAAIHFAASQFVAVCHSGEILRSTDGLAWTAVHRSASEASLSHVTYGNGRWIVTGSTSFTSTDGANWTPLASIAQGGDVLFAGGVFVLLQSGITPDAQIATSTDGLVWTSRYSVAYPSVGALAHGNGTWVAAASRGTILQSPDADLAAAPQFTFVTAPPYAVALGDTLTLLAPAAGSTPIAYQWILDGEPIVGATSSSFTIVPTNSSVVSSGDHHALAVVDAVSTPATTPPAAPTSENHHYTLEARNASGTGVVGFTVTTYYSPLPTVTTQFTRIGGGTADLTVSVVGAGPFTYQWSKNGVPLAGATDATLTIAIGTPAENAAVYTVAVTNTHGTVPGGSLSLAPRILYSPASLVAAPGQYNYFSVSIDADDADPYSSVSIWTKNGQIVARNPFFRPYPYNGGLIATYPNRYPSTSAIQPSDYGVYQVTVTNAYGSVTTPAFTLSPPASTRLVNLSARARVGTGDDVLIVGFIGSPGSMPNVLLRGVGPGLAALGVRATLTDPVLSLQRADGHVEATNDTWEFQPDFVAGAPAEIMARIGAFPLPVGSADATLFRPIINGADDRPTNTAIVSGQDGGTGIALLEIYDYAESSQRLINLSARARVGTGDDVLIAGFVIAGDQPLKVLIRGVGPALAAQGVSAPLANPKITLYDVAGNALHNNDQWSEATNLADLRAATSTVGAFALTDGSNDAAMLETLAPGAYTVHVTSVDGSAGIALVEIYAVP